MSEENNTETTENKAENNTETETTETQTEITEKSVDEKLQEAKTKELDLLKQRNANLELQLKGKSTYIPPQDKEKKEIQDCNDWLKSTGMSI